MTAKGMNTLVEAKSGLLRVGSIAFLVGFMTALLAARAFYSKEKTLPTVDSDSLDEWEECLGI